MRILIYGAGMIGSLYFQGKIDIGSGNSGIISQLKMQNEMKLTDESWISYQ